MVMAMNAKEYWFHRLQRYHKEMLKYSRYIFNDHLMMVGIIFLGFCAVQYASFIKQLTVIGPIMVYGLAGCMSVLPFIGRLVTLIEEADGHFLASEVREWKKYFIYSFIYSLWLPIVLNGVIIVILSPLLLKSPFITSGKLILLFALISILKCLDLEKELFSLETIKIKHIIMNVVQAIVTYIIITVSLLSDVRVCLVLVVLLGGVMVTIVHHWYHKESLFNWQRIAVDEIVRQDKWYRFIELFVDTNHCKKAKIHNSVITKVFQCYLSFENDSPSNYLFSRTLTRVDAYNRFFGKFTAMIILFSFGISSAPLYLLFLAICLTIEVIYISSLANYHEKHLLMKILNLSTTKTSNTIINIIIRCLTIQEIICLIVIVKYTFSWIYLLYIVALNIYLLIFVKFFMFKRTNIKKGKKTLTKFKKC